MKSLADYLEGEQSLDTAIYDALVALRKRIAILEAEVANLKAERNIYQARASSFQNTEDQR